MLFIDRFCILFFFVFFSPFIGCSATPLRVPVSAESAILMNADTGKILYQKKARSLRYPASLTKVAAALYVLEKKLSMIEEVAVCTSSCLKKMSQEVKISRLYQDPPYLLEPDGTHFFLLPREKMKIKDLLFGMMISSGNDASNVVAQHVGGSIPVFMKELNEYLREIGCESTCFVNPHGLHHPQHRTTAFDLAMVAQRALKHPLLCEMGQTKEYYRPKTNLQAVKVCKQRNRLLREGKFFYPAAFGMKTGYVEKAGYTLMATARKNGRTLVLILLGCPSSDQRFSDAIRLFDAAFEESKVKRLLFNQQENEFSCHFKEGARPVKAHLLDHVFVEYYPSEEPNIKIELNWESKPLPIKEGTFVGQLCVRDQEGKLLGSYPLSALYRVDLSLWGEMKGIFRGHIPVSLIGKAVFLGLCALGLLVLLYFFSKCKRKV